MARILIVDDEGDVVTLITFVLEKDGHRVVPAHHPGIAFELLGLEPPAEGKTLPDLIIMDMLMPVMDGLTACGKLAAARPEIRNIPVIVLSAKGALRESFEKHPNVKGFVDKPFDPKRLRDEIDSVLPPRPPRG